MNNYRFFAFIFHIVHCNHFLSVSHSCLWSWAPNIWIFLKYLFFSWELKGNDKQLMVQMVFKNPCYTLYWKCSGWYWTERMGKYFNLGMQILLDIPWKPSGPKEIEGEHISWRLTHGFGISNWGRMPAHDEQLKDNPTVILGSCWQLPIGFGLVIYLPCKAGGLHPTVWQCQP